MEVSSKGRSEIELTFALTLGTKTFKGLEN